MSYDEDKKKETLRRLGSETRMCRLKERRIKKESSRESIFHCRKCGATYMKAYSGCPLCEADKRSMG